MDFKVHGSSKFKVTSLWWWSRRFLHFFQTVRPATKTESVEYFRIPIHPRNITYIDVLVRYNSLRINDDINTLDRYSIIILSWYVVKSDETSNFVIAARR